ncbi:NAD(P)/FAD-dependent oxidoreductase [Solirubrobacter sp. CPCC 204708]|uniref:NAD(P)/FAD-dependent oxidoreductase n=1 Tax=Solirubrobacter deserti TaxID=2282478 RepID=A0ABT4RSZ9_9ACTN|nr:NAD(P)/FAD-dependent oxidoreductase [Solirubrobacter deserti]MBE2320357.1 NAD(P)/FAD-dependent oxidoreductase [Solirubrobacter deserti]MDA0141709.1 NAD(P)/FAD-dependent oxidoreductase [Solirubrobacter deserti]
MEHVDVVIVGAGLSGIGAARHLQDRLPDLSFALLEARDAIGGTWDLFRYPGVRSDSDMQTLGYRFKPWTDEKALADGPSILEYVRETARETGVDRHIRFNHKVTDAAWADGRWTLTIEGQEPLSCSFLYVCGGYYRYDEGYLPSFADREAFTGEIIHPQFWPEDFDYTGKRIVVIGSGATAVTIVPAMADKAAHVTMLQRSPTYILSLPSKDKLALKLRKLLGDRRGYQVTRWKNVAVSTLVYQLSQRFPTLMRKVIRKGVIARVPPGYPVDTHFNPTYGPWDQRLCLVPDGDLFRALRKEQASIVTDRVERFTPTGIQLASGQHLEADVIVTATGLNLQAFGGIALTVDGQPVHLPDHLAYKGMMLSDVPNFVFTIGYTNASWTLKADLVAEFTCRVLAHMREGGYTTCVPVDDGGVPRKPLLDFEAGYVQRSLHLFPQAGAKAPWRLGMNYAQDVVTLRHGKLDDGALRFTA